MINVLKYSVFVFMVYSGLLSALYANSALQRTPSINILSSDENALTIEFTLPDFTVQETRRHSEYNQIIQVPGFSQTADPRAPQLPVTAVTFGIPHDAQPTLRILDKQTGYIPEAFITPAADIELPVSETPWLPDPDRQPVYVYETGEVYQSNSLYPNEPIQLNDPVIMRGQRMSALRIRPFQYNPVSKRVQLIKSAIIRIDFNSALGKRSAALRTAPADTFFRPLYQNTLINYEQAKSFLEPPRALRKQNNGGYFLDQGSEWLKLQVDHNAIYWLEKSDLDAAGFDMTGKDPRNLKLFNKGEEIAIHVHGQDDGSFDSGDYIEFYGDGHKSFYSHTNVYWLTVSGSSGLRMSEKDGAPDASASVLTRGKTRTHFEKDVDYISNFPNSTNEDRWRWDWIAGGYSSYESWTTPIILYNISNIAASDCYFKTWVKGGTLDNNVYPDHHFITYIAPASDPSDKSLVMDHQFDGQVLAVHEESFSQLVLKENNLVVEYFGPGDTGAGLDVLHIMKFQVEYWQDWLAINDSLTIRPQGSGVVECHIKSFQDNSLLLYDVSDSTAPQRVLNADVTADGAVYTLSFQGDVSGNPKYTAITPDKRYKPDSVYMDSNSDWRNTGRQSDYVLIVFDDFAEAVAGFAEFKQQQGYRVHTVKVQDVYDEFNYGLYSDQALKNFFQYAYDFWTTAPAYVLLVGDASWNPRMVNPGKYGSSRSDFVPTHMFETIYQNNESPTDQWYACVDGGDIIPDMMVGRVPSRSLNEARGIMDKLLAYQSDYENSDWNKRLIFATDDNEAEFDFTGNSDALIADNVPGLYRIEKIYLDDYGSASAAKTALLDAWDQGALFVNYQGHGSNQQWANENMLHRTDIPGMRNGSRLPVVLIEACKNGDFVDPRIERTCLAEFFLKERSRGAAGMYTGAGFAFLTPVQTMADEFYHDVLINQQPVWGQSVMTASQVMYSTHPSYWDHVWFYISFGDPSMALHLPAAEHFVSAQYSGTVSMGGEPLAAGSPVTIWNGDNFLQETSVQNDSGRIGPLRIYADNPETATLDGARAGDTLTFKVSMGSDTLNLMPEVVWRPGDKKTVNWTVMTTSVQENTIHTIAYQIHSEQRLQDVFSGDIIPANSRLWVILESEQHVITDRLGFYLNEDPVEFEVVEQTGSKTRLQLNTSGWPDGTYELSLDTPLHLGNEAAKLNKIMFRLESDCALEQVMNVPNPMRDETEFTFVLVNDKSADVTRFDCSQQAADSFACYSPDYCRWVSMRFPGTAGMETAIELRMASICIRLKQKIRMNRCKKPEKSWLPDEKCCFFVKIL
ncbi:MAG: C25 family cysteine peptidase [candidate division KSB1 bacterium]|nr:C25 family cysteine peptidase [candidate division KSB1 bacterium]